MSYSISIPEYENNSDYVDYVLLVTDQQTDEIWNFKRRYSKLRKVYESLKKFTKDLAFPGKKLFGNKSSQFLDQRKHDLQKIFQELLRIPGLAQNPEFLEFIKPHDRKVLKDPKQSPSNNRRGHAKSNVEIEKAIKNICDRISEETTSKFVDLGAQPNPIQDDDAKKRVNEVFKAANGLQFEHKLLLPEGANINETHLNKPITDHKPWLERLFSEISISAEEKQVQESLIQKLDR